MKNAPPAYQDRPRRHALLPRFTALLFLAGVGFSFCVYTLWNPWNSGQVSSRSSPSSSSLSSDSNNNRKPNLNLNLTSSPRRVAILGAGASGSAAAFFLTRAAREAESLAGLPSGTLLDPVVVYEKEGYVGGRSTTVHPHGDEKLPAIELGASIFVEANRNLVRAAKLFNLSLEDPSFSDGGIAIWDGSEFLFTTTVHKTRWSSWWDTLAALRHYGPLSPFRQGRAVKALLAKFQRLYDPAWLAERGTVSSIEEFATAVELGLDLTTVPARQWAVSTIGVSQRWADEIMEASTRVNYARDLTDIHALGASVSLATGGASSVAGGNWRIFEGFLKHAGADVRLGREVRAIAHNDSSVVVYSSATSDSGTNASTEAAGRDGEVYDELFFAAPGHDWNVPTGPNPNPEADWFTPPSRPDYVHLHVTLLATRSPYPRPEFFNLPADTAIPRTILTTNATARSRSQDDTTAAVPLPFQSLSYHGETAPDSGEWVVKLFSLSPLSNAFLHDIFGDDPTWVYRKEWRSYPALKPIASYAPVEPVPHVQYLAAMEPWVSTMETQTLSAREAVARVVERWWGVGAGECDGVEGEGWDLTCGE